ncbi:MAG: hypothetical protein ACKKMR_03570 [Candidatus Nealsonbacteria bacterium]
MSKTIIAIIVIIIVAGLGYWIYQSTLAPEELTEKEQACINSGGEVLTSLCCKATGDFPNLCLIGPCGCSPENSHEIKVCDCGEKKCFDGNTCVPEVYSFNDCIKAGYPVMESYPRQCKTPDGRIFTEGEEHCIAPTGESMSLFEAMQIAITSECGDQLRNYLEFATCNADTGTWWIDLDIEKEGCNPACVVNIATKEASINWRCTGVLEINSFDDCVEAGYAILPPIPGGYTECRTPDGKVFYFEEIDDASLCARDGEVFSRVSDQYLDSCCEGLKEWIPIPDTRFSIADVCYEVGLPSESNIGLCIKCGDGVCENHLNYDENPCNCPEDCKGKNKSMFQSIEEFCQSNDWKMSLSKACEEQEPIKGSPICKLCAF